MYKKHHPPVLFDEVWRLEKIGKDGAFHKRLSRESINTVKDFLTLLVLDPSRLRHVRFIPSLVLGILLVLEIILNAFCRRFYPIVVLWQLR